MTWLYKDITENDKILSPQQKRTYSSLMSRPSLMKIACISSHSKNQWLVSKKKNNDNALFRLCVNIPDNELYCILCTSDFCSNRMTHINVFVTLTMSSLGSLSSDFPIRKNPCRKKNKLEVFSFNCKRQTMASRY